MTNPELPSPSTPPSIEPDPALGRSSTGLDPKVAATLSYLVGWITGVLFFLLERENRYVRFHAMQSIVGLGGLWALGLALWLFSFAMIFVSASAFHLMMTFAQVVWLAGLIAWLICLYKAYSGEWWKLPLAGDIAERIVQR